jgi:hypothetical protein
MKNIQILQNNYFQGQTVALYLHYHQDSKASVNFNL